MWWTIGVVSIIGIVITAVIFAWCLAPYILAPPPDEPDHWKHP